ncbi:MAG: hypothetical protein U9R14_04920 [Patescibacteria group bacterium]|nr:hypothetical protein [Patescibacteria group bacterium]
MKKCIRGNYKPSEEFKLPDGANPTNFNGPRDVFCQHYNDCMEYMLQKNQYSRYFSYVDCEKASKAIRASKPAKAKNTDSAQLNIQKKKPAVKKFGLPDGANPVYVNGLVDIFCDFYKDCRKYVRREHKNWRYFSCTKCPKASKFIRAQGSNSKAKVLEGQRQPQKILMGYKVIQQKNYGRKL